MRKGNVTKDKSARSEPPLAVFSEKPCGFTFSTLRVRYQMEMGRCGNSSNLRFPLAYRTCIFVYEVLRCEKFYIFGIKQTKWCKLLTSKIWSLRLYLLNRPSKRLRNPPEPHDKVPQRKVSILALHSADFAFCGIGSWSGLRDEKLIVRAFYFSDLCFYLAHSCRIIAEKY